MQPFKIFSLLLFCLLISSKALEIQNENKLNIEKPKKLSTIFPSEFPSEDTKEVFRYQLKNNVKTFSYNHNGNLLIDAKMNTDKKKLTINFAFNYKKSAEAKYYIFIGPKNNKITLNDFNDPNFLIESVNQNLNQVKIYELKYTEVKPDINTNIDVSDLISRYGEKQEFRLNRWI